jgi:murein DD-endopeptidase MepM/ murein hydrolase activator NlpD
LNYLSSLFTILLLSSCSNIKYYQLKQDDTPVSLSKKFDIPLCTLRMANEGSSGDTIKIPRYFGLFAPDGEQCDVTENLLLQGDFLWPLKGSQKVSSFFGMRWNRHHKGIDIPAPKGTPILASKTGLVIYRGYQKRGYGNVIILQHEDGSHTVYAHSQKTIVKKGKSVEKGQVIGFVGRTGKTTGSHLHFEIKLKGTFVNPLEYLARTTEDDQTTF